MFLCYSVHKQTVASGGGLLRCRSWHFQSGPHLCATVHSPSASNKILESATTPRDPSTVQVSGCAALALRNPVLSIPFRNAFSQYRLQPVPNLHHFAFVSHDQGSPFPAGAPHSLPQSVCKRKVYYSDRNALK